MAHFAELKAMTDPTGFTSDSHQVVQRVVVVANDEVPSDMHVDGETWCINFFNGGIWKQTSYNNNFRKNYASVGYTFDFERDAFIPPQPYLSWVLNEDSCQWEPPTPYPDVDNKYVWDEESQEGNNLGPALPE